MNESLYEVNHSDCESELEICKHYAESLPYPVVLIDREGIISYKSLKFKCINLKWRVGAKIKHYIGAGAFSALLGLRIGAYVSIFNLGVGAVGLKVGEFYFIIFLPKFEIHDAFAETIYNYIGSIPEKDFFESRNLYLVDDKTDKTYQRWERFKKGFNTFYLNKCSYDTCASRLFDGDGSKRTFDLVNIIESIAKIVNNTSARFGYSIKLNANEASGEYLIDATGEDMCSIFSIVLFLCARCSSAKNPVVEVEFYKALASSSLNRICFSVKSEIGISELKMSFENDLCNNELSLYFNTLKYLAAKYFWGIRACRGDADLHFVILLSKSSFSSDLWLNDSEIYHDDIEEKFTEFTSLTGLFE